VVNFASEENTSVSIEQEAGRLTATVEVVAKKKIPAGSRTLVIQS
jgi:hypothetical protein